MQHEVPFSSQYTDLGHHEWRYRGCGIAALKMAMDFYAPAPSLEELLKVGLEAGAYREGVGWSHRGLVAIAERYGYEGFHADWAEKGPTPKTAEDAWRFLLDALERGPVLVSVFPKMDAERVGGHIIVVTGFHDDLVFFNDPEELSEREGKKQVALTSFLKAFKRRYIVVRPRS